MDAQIEQKIRHQHSLLARLDLVAQFENNSLVELLEYWIAHNHELGMVEATLVKMENDVRSLHNKYIPGWSEKWLRINPNPQPNVA